MGAKGERMKTEAQATHSGIHCVALPLVSPAASRKLQLSFLAVCVGFLFSSRTVYVLISARWLNISTEPGVFAGFGIAAALGLAVVLNAFGKRTHPSRRTLALRPFQWVVLYLAFSGCSLLWSASVSASSSTLYWCGLVCDVGVVVLLLRAGDAECVAHSLMRGFIAGACVLAVIAWIMPAASDLRLGDLEYFNTNQIGNLCALSLLMCTLLSTRGDGVWRGVNWFLAFTLFRSMSKSTLIAFAACLLYRLVCDSSVSRGKKWLLSAAVLVVTLSFWGLLSAYYDVYTTAGNQAETLTGRTAIWAWTLDAGLSKPWFGNGFDAMWKVAPPFGGDLFEARHAENELLQQFFAYGICGVVLLVGVYGSLYRRIRTLPRSSERSALTAFLVFVLVRGLAEAEPFDLLLPLWLVTVLAVLAEGEIKSEERIPAERAPATEMKALPAC